MPRVSPSARVDLGAEPLPGNRTRFCVWAPRHDSVELLLESGDAGEPDRVQALEAADRGYFAAVVERVGPGQLYRFRLPGEDRPYPDPASRYQPHGPHGPSMVVDSTAFQWTDAGWRGPDPDGQVIYETHIGTFTHEGTWAAAAGQLEALAETGVTTIELMPVAEFDGRFGWGYDGVDLFAPSHLYGTPDDFRRFVDRAHAVGLAVILDVVYNHLGPSGNYLTRFSPDYFTDRYENEWGEPINFDGRYSREVRAFFLQNAEYWIRDFHLDGLRLDATQQIFDSSDEHIIAEIAAAVRTAGGGRRTYLVGENEPQDVVLIREHEEGGYGLDGLWNDDFHHSAVVALTGRNEAYYTDYLGNPQELISSAKWGFLYQGQRYSWQGKRRGTATFGIAPRRFVNFIENHDQIANSRAGSRLHTQSSPGAYRAMTTLLLLGPGTPMLFQGQEFASSAPFLYFADQEPDLAAAVRKGRGKFLEQFRSLAAPDGSQTLADPADPETFRRCKLDHSERMAHAEAYALHRDLLRLRREDPVFRLGRPGGVDGAVLGAEAFVLRFFGQGEGDRLLIVNLGRDLHLDPAPEPLLGPPSQGAWSLEWSSERAVYGGVGAAEVETEDGWIIPGQAAVVLLPAELPEPPGRRGRAGVDS